MEEFLKGYADYLRNRKGRSENTVRSYISDLLPFLAFLKRANLHPTQLGRSHLRSYLAWLMTGARGRKGGYARASVSRKLVALRSFYRYLAQEGVIEANPIPKGRAFRIKRERHLPRFLGQREVEKLLEAPDLSKPTGIRDRAILELLYSSGLRLSELAGLDLKDVDLAGQEVRVRGKGSKERLVLVGRPAVEALRRYLASVRPALAKGDSEALFLNRYGGRLSRRSIQRKVVRYALKAGIATGVHTHTIRHTFATHLLEGGADLRVVQELLGHSSPAATQVYTHITPSQARRVYLSAHPGAREEEK